MISKQLICVFWIMCLSVGLFEVIFTPLKEVGIVAIYMSIMGLLRETSFNKGNPKLELCDDRDFFLTGKY